VEQGRSWTLIGMGVSELFLLTQVAAAQPRQGVAVSQLGGGRQSFDPVRASLREAVQISG
jgi:hypothetical protein